MRKKEKNREQNGERYRESKGGESIKSTAGNYFGGICGGSYHLCGAP